MSAISNDYVMEGNCVFTLAQFVGYDLKTPPTQYGKPYTCVYYLNVIKE